MKKLLLLAITGIFIFYSCKKNNSSTTPDPVKDSTENKDTGLIKNSGFEQEVYFLQGDSLWQTTGWQIADGVFTWEKGNGRDGTNCISIFSDRSGGNDLTAYEVLKLQPATEYEITGWIKTVNVDSGYGANLCIYSTSSFVRSVGIMGTNDWKRDTLDFTTPDLIGDVNLGCRLGYFGGSSNGKAYFDDLSITVK